MANKELHNALMELSSPEERVEVVFEELQELIKRINGIERTIESEKEISRKNIVKKTDTSFIEPLTTELKRVKSSVSSLSDYIDVIKSDLRDSIIDTRKELHDSIKSLDASIARITDDAGKVKMNVFDSISDVSKELKSSMKAIADSVSELKDSIEKEAKKSKSTGGGSMYFGMSSKALTGAIDGANLKYTFTGFIGNPTMVLLQSPSGMKEGLVWFIETAHYTRSGGYITFTTAIDASYSGYTLSLMYIS